MTRVLLSVVLLFGSLVSSGCPIVVTCEDVPCPFGEVCNLETGLCEDVVQDCRTDDRICRSGEVCDELSGRCRPERLRCAEQFKPCPEGQACNATSGFCEPTTLCASDADCGIAEQCNEATQECEPLSCDSSRDSCPLGYVCGEDRHCVPGCRPGEDSCPTRQFCLVITGDQIGRCVPNCRVDGECPFGQVCDVAAAPDSRCVAEPPCSVDADCREDEICDRMACIQPPCQSDVDCLASQICEIATGTCRDATCEDDVYGAGPTPNYSRETAFGLAIGQYTELELCPGRSDWFAVDVRSTDVVRVRLRQHVAEPDLDLYVYDENGVPLVANELAGSVTSVKFAAGRAQTVFVEVRGRDFEPATYDLTLSTEFCANDSFEENDTRNTATVVPSAVGVPSEIALQACGFDEDWFRLQVPAEDNGLRVQRVAGTPDLRVDLYTPDGDILSVVRDAPLALLRSGAPGSYWVRAVGALGQSGAYRLTFEVLEPWACPGLAQHATPSVARIVAEEAIAVEALCPLDGGWEIDWIELPITDAGVIDAHVRPLAGAPPLEVALVDFDGIESKIVRTAVRLAGESVLQAAADPTRQYYLRVGSSDPVGRITVEPRYEVEWLLLR